MDIDSPAFDPAKLLHGLKRHLGRCEELIETRDSWPKPAERELAQTLFVHYRKCKAALKVLEETYDSNYLHSLDPSLDSRINNLPAISLFDRAGDPLDQDFGKDTSMIHSAVAKNRPPLCDDRQILDSMLAAESVNVSQASHLAGAQDIVDAPQDIVDAPQIQPILGTVVGRPIQKSKPKWYTNRQELLAFKEEEEDRTSSTIDGSDAQMAENILQHHRENQENLSNDLLNMSKSLRANAASLSSTLEKDRSILEQADLRLAANLTRTKKEGGRLDQYVAKSSSTTGLLILSLVVAISGWIIAFVVIRLT